MVPTEITEAFLQQTLDAWKQEVLDSLHALMPGVIVSYDAESGLATVQPALHRKTVSGDVLTAPRLYEVPVFCPSSSFMVSAGDPCLLLFSDFCLDGWLQSRQPVLPPSPRRHDLSDAIALAGFFPAFRR